MKNYTIEAVAFGSFWVKDVDCPYGWLGSGVYDVDYTTRLEGVVTICARSLEEAVKEVPKAVMWRDYDRFFYDPSTVIEKDAPDEDDDDAWEVDSEFGEQEMFRDEEDALDGMERYSKEA